MPIDVKLLKILACPDDKADVKYKKSGKKESLVCSKCKRIFEIKDNIPIMLPKNATV
jgi:uncharacterized protein YbaR (Trm112 family)